VQQAPADSSTKSSSDWSATVGNGGAGTGAAGQAAGAAAQIELCEHLKWGKGRRESCKQQTIVS